MKKNLLALVALAAIYSASAQTVYVKDQAVLAVKPNTLMYMGNGLEISSDNANTVVNEGNIQINLSNLAPGFSNSTTESTAYYYRNFKTDGSTVSDGKNFVNKYTSNTSYGQVMFTNNGISDHNYSKINRVEGKMALEQPYVSTSSYNWLPISLPFAFSVNDAGTAGSILGNTFGITSTQYIYNDTPATSTNTGRYKSTIMRWSRQGQYYKSVDSTELLKGASYAFSTYIMNLQSGELKTIFDSHNTTTDRILYLGSPYGLTINEIVLNTSSTQTDPPYAPWTNFYTSTEPWSTWKERKNPANERYRTYIGESFTTEADNSTTYGKYLATFGNPFTHNLDLAQMFASKTASDYYRSDIKAIQKVGSSVTWNVKQGNTTAVQTTLIASLPDNTGDVYNPAATNKQWTGDKAALLLKPFEVAQFKFSYKHLTSNPDGASRAYQYYNFDDNTFWATTPKTFNYTSSATITSTTPVAKASKVSVTNTQEKLTVSDYNLGLYQLGLSLTNKEETLGNRVYLVAIDKDVTGKKAEFEVDYTEANTSSAIWANQENSNETYDSGSSLYINGFNMNDYIAKPLYITFQKGNDTNTQFVIKSNLAEGSTLNDELDKLSNGNKFYFVDKKENKSFEITKDFTYTFTANESSNDRFVVYWNAIPKNLGTGEAEVNKNKTFIYKNGASTNSIRFAKKNLTANIKIYNLSGQLVSSKEKVATAQDFNINNIENGMYIVNIEYSDNTVETLKSIFKK